MVATGNAALQFMAALRQEKGIDWSKVTLFHLDEYVGLSDKHPASFRLFIRTKLKLSGQIPPMGQPFTRLPRAIHQGLLYLAKERLLPGNAPRPFALPSRGRRRA